MAVYVSKYTNNLGQRVDLIIADIITPDQETIQLADNPITIDYSVKDEDDIFSPIMAGRAEVRVILGEDVVSTNFFEDMSNVQEGEYELFVRVHDGGSTTYGAFQGYVVPDGLQRGISYFNDIITIRAVDSIERLKSYTLRKIDGTQFVGRFKLSQYLNALLEPPGAFLGDIETDVKLSLSPASPLPATSLFEQLWVDASVFNDNQGRPINSYEALELIAYSLGCRAILDYTTGFPTLNMYEVASYNIKAPGNLDIGIKDYLGRSANFLLGNNEVVSRVKTFKEVKGSFSYEGADGIVENGAMQFYDVDGKPQNADVNAPLLALPDMNVRKRGNGRPENPYGFMLKSTYVEPDGTDLSRRIDTWDMIAFRTPTGAGIPRSTEVSIGVTARLEDVGSIWTIDDQTYTAMIVDAIIYNDSNPASSVRSKLDSDGVPIWETVDLSANAVFASGHYDFNVNSRDKAWFALVPPTLETFGSPANFISQYGTPIKFAGVKDVSQTVSVDLSPSPVGGTLYVSISQIFDIGPMQTTPDIPELNASTEMNTRIEGVLVSAKGLSEGKTETVYITRYGDHTTDKNEFEIKLNTTATPTAKGSLWTDVTYQDDNSKVGRFYRGPGWVRGVNTPLFSPSERVRRYISLVQYNAIARMAYNGTQNKLDFSVLAGSLPIENTITFTDLLNTGRPSTYLYNQFHIQQRQKWNVTTGERSITAISLAPYAQDIEDGTEQDAPTETVDVMEKYYQ